MTFVVEPNYAGWRLDRYLCEKIRRLSRTRVQRILERSLVADRPLKPSTRVHPGLTFTLRRRAQAEPEVPEDIVELYLDRTSWCSTSRRVCPSTPPPGTTTTRW